MLNKSCLALLLDGPMQSWGFTSRFTRRTTALHPTKSAIVGLLAAAMRIDKNASGEAHIIARLASLECTTITLPKKQNGTELALVRLIDYQTIGGGYNKSTQWMKKPRSASGKTLETVLSQRHYLLDARFGVLLNGDRDGLEEIANHLRNPAWGVWLGRKCCIPSSPLLVGIGCDSVEAWQLLLKAATIDKDAPMTQFDHVIECEDNDRVDGEWLNDFPLAFGSQIGERHGPRRIREIKRIRL